jgi:hypothetical protein
MGGLGGMAAWPHHGYGPGSPRKNVIKVSLKNTRTSINFRREKVLRLLPKSNFDEVM